MPNAPLDAVLCHIRQLAGKGALEDTPDQHLLRRFADEPDEVASACRKYRDTAATRLVYSRLSPQQRKNLTAQ